VCIVMSAFCYRFSPQITEFKKRRFYINLENPASVTYEMLKNAFLVDIIGRT